VQGKQVDSAVFTRPVISQGYGYDEQYGPQEGGGNICDTEEILVVKSQVALMYT
jgi:hypothetical protein